MGEVRMCFDAGAYKRALADVRRLGFDVSGQEVNLTGKYYCESDVEGRFLIDKSEQVTGYIYGQPLWTDRSGRMFNVIDEKDLPAGVIAAAWGYVPYGDNLMLQSIRDYYKCESKGNKKCVENMTENYSEKAEEGIGDYEKKGNAFWDKAQQLIDLAKKCDGGPGGINPNDLVTIRNDYLAKKETPRNIETAKKYAETSEKMFEAMVRNSSGYECIEERGNEIGCKYTKRVVKYDGNCGYDHGSSDGWTADVQCDGLGYYAHVEYEYASCTPKCGPNERYDGFGCKPITGNKWL